jgi:hypothetical protein
VGSTTATLQMVGSQSLPGRLSATRQEQESICGSGVQEARGDDSKRLADCEHGETGVRMRRHGLSHMGPYHRSKLSGR